MGFDDQEIEGFLAGAFEGGQGDRAGSVLDEIERLHGAGSSLLLRETDADAAPVMLRREDGGAQHDARYHVLGEIARGGIGIIYRGRDKDLNRDVALKVLRPEYADRADVVQRFVEEAQVGGQLQHPGIVPVYGLGLQPDGRPCFAMRLIKGETLAELLDVNPKGLDLLAVFEQVVQTIAYAHSRGVIHRDLKPANVMVGAFGEVQVVDWGFAKVLGQEELTPRPEQTVIATVRSEGEGSDSMAGSVMGTPAYMPPEQAMGRIDELDERADVFALGAILCEILTGKPPYTGDPRDILVAATQSRLDDAYARLDAANAADGLKQLARDCLEPMSAERPRNASRVAERIAAHLADVENSARKAQLDALAAEEDAAQQRHGRRRTLVLAGLALFAAFVGGGGYGWWKSGHDAREARAMPLIAAALRDATRFEGEEDWASAAASAQRAVDVAASEGVAEAGARAMLARFEHERDTAETERILAAADAQFLAEIEEARAQGADHYRWEEIDAAFVTAVARRFPDMEVDTVRLAASPDAPAFAAAFDGWARYRRKRKALADKDWKKVDALARAIDAENNYLRDAMAEDDVVALEALIETLDLATLSTGMIYHLGRSLWSAEHYASAIALMDRAHLLHPDDFWIHWRLASAARKSKRHDLALQHYAAALAIRPKSREVRHYFGVALLQAGDVEGAIDAWQTAFELYPDWNHGMRHIADALHTQGRNDEAIQAFRAAVDRNPDDYDMLEELGMFYRDTLGDAESAIAAFRAGIELVPDEAWPYSSIGKAMIKAGRFDDAIPELEKAIELDPEYTWPYVHLANAFVGKGDAERAIEVLDRMPLDSESKPRWTYYAQLVKRLHANGQRDAAIQMAKRAQVLAPADDVPAHAWVAYAYLQKGIAEYPDAADALDEAIAWYQKTIELDPLEAQHHTFLGSAWYWKDDNDAAKASLERALELEPEHQTARNLLGTVLNTQGDWRRTAAMLRQELARNPRNLNARAGLANTLIQGGAGDEALRLLRRGVEASPLQFQPRAVLCAFLAGMWRTDEAIREYQRAIEDFPQVLTIRMQYAGLLADRLRRYADAAVQYRKIVEMDPRSVAGHYALGTALHKAERLAEGLAHLERALELNPSYAEAHCNTGQLLRTMGRWSESLEQFRRGHELGTKRGSWRYPSERWVDEAAQILALEPQFERAVAGQEVEVTHEERALLGAMLRARGHFALAAQCYRDAFRDDPTLMEIGKGHRNDALQAAAQAGEDWHPQAQALLGDYIDRRRANLDDEAIGAVIDILTWRSMPALAGVRAGGEHAAAWKPIWTDLDTLFDDALKVVRR